MLVLAGRSFLSRTLSFSAGGSYCKVRNNNMKVLDLALVALLQPPVSNKIPGYLFFSKLDHGTINSDTRHERSMLYSARV